MNLRVVVLPKKVLANGTHKVRIAMSHKRQTRYFVTRFVVPSPNNIVNGQVVGVNNASYINQQLRIRMSKIYTICDQAKDIEYLSCSQLMQFIENAEQNASPKSIHEIGEIFFATKRDSFKEKRFNLYKSALNEFESCFGSDYLLQMLASDDLYRFERYMKEVRNLSSTTISIRMRSLKTIINFAIRQKKVEFNVNPYIDYSIPVALKRQCSITLEQLRMLKNIDLSEQRYKRIGYVRDIFLLSFYLCGMNLVDILSQDFSKSTVRFLRTKTATRKRTAIPTEFTIQPEAREILNRLTKDGNLVFGHKRSVDAINGMLFNHLPKLAKLCGIESTFIYYSARKTFAQLANQLFIKDSIIEYCIGDTVTQSKKVIGFYIEVTPQMADLAIRRVFDAVASNKNLEQLQAEAMCRPAYNQ